MLFRSEADTLARIQLIHKQAKLADKAGNPRSSLRWLTRALQLLEDASEPEAAVQRARLSAEYSSVRAGQGRSKDAISWAERAIAEAEAVEEREALANAHYMIAWTRVNQGEFGQESHFERALSLFEELGDVKRQGDVLTYFGAMAYWEGRWREAVELYERGRERSQRAGRADGVAGDVDPPPGVLGPGEAGHDDDGEQAEHDHAERRVEVAPWAPTPAAQAAELGGHRPPPGERLRGHHR